MSENQPDQGTTGDLRSALARKTLSMSDEEFVEFLFKRVVAEAENRIITREHQRWTIIFLTVPLIIGAIGFLGYKSFSDMQSDLLNEVVRQVKSDDLLNKEIETAVDVNMRAEFDRLNDQLTDEISLVRLVSLAYQVRSDDRVTPQKAEAILADLRDLVDNTGAAARADFATALEDVLDAFYQGDLDREIDELETSFRSRIEGVPGMCLTLTWHYGERFLGDPSATQATKERFLRYAGLIKNEYPAEAYSYLLAYEHSFGGAGKSERIAALLQDVGQWDDAKKESLLEEIDESLPDSATTRMQRMADKFTAFRENHAEELRSVSGVPDRQRDAVLEEPGNE